MIYVNVNGVQDFGFKKTQKTISSVKGRDFNITVPQAVSRRTIYNQIKSDYKLPLSIQMI